MPDTEGVFQFHAQYGSDGCDKGGKCEQVVETHAASVSAVLDCSDCETAYMHRKAADGKGMITWQYWVEKN